MSGAVRPRLPLLLRSICVALPLLVTLAACDDETATTPPAPSASTPLPTASAPPVASTPPSHDAGAPEPPKKAHAPCTHDAVVTFDDPAIEAIVRRQLQQPTGPIKRASLHTIKTFNASQTKMDDLDPCLFSELTGVKDLYLPRGAIRDLTPLRPLVHLEGLGFARTEVKDLSPVAGFAHMDRLDLSHTQVTDLTPIAGLTDITEITLDDTAVADLTPLTKMTKLEMVSLQNTPVTSVMALHGMTHLKKLYIAGSLVTDLSPVQSIHGIKIFQQGR
jgi:internalin A